MSVVACAGEVVVASVGLSKMDALWQKHLRALRLEHLIDIAAPFPQLWKAQLEKAHEHGVA